jgi:hypothetical protein
MPALPHHKLVWRGKAGPTGHHSGDAGLQNEEHFMKKMTTFNPVWLPTDPDDPDYRAAIAEIRRWAGPHVHFGTADQLVTGEHEELLLHELVVASICALKLVPSEAYGSTLTYTAETPYDAATSDTGAVEALQLHMRVEPGAVIQIVGVSVVERGSSEGPDWCFRLTAPAHELSIATFLDDNGVDPGVDVLTLANAIEDEGARQAALARA